MRRRRRNRWLMDQLVRELAVDRRPGPLLAIWRWRWEAGLAAALVTAARLVNLGVLLLSAGIFAALYAVIPALRRFTASRFWCVMTQHRLRAGMREADVRSWSGRMPAILWTAARGQSQRILVTCPAGVDVRQIDAVRGVLAAACWATEVVVEQHPRYANVVTLTVIRRASTDGNNGD